MATLAMLVGGLFGVFLRNGVDPFDRTRTQPYEWRTVSVSVLGGFVLGALAGATLGGVHGDGVLTVAGIGFSSALLTFCLFGAATATVIREGIAWHTVLPALTDVFSGFGAATVGVLISVALVS